ncbi:unnamed protein product [Owenia fusiformis]|uniref:Uncharacterized protein n=1 Tax=Owenia fusiformis TaxID=6347 RepID=A0A8J1TYY6_OWEFU|nr:unnamed protein product [Owenia fusiformis]
MKVLKVAVTLVLFSKAIFGGFVRVPEDKAGFVGSDIIMDCHINDTDECGLLWYRKSNADSNEIQISRCEKILKDMSKKLPGKYKISSRAPYSLIIKNLTYSDSGKYRCYNTIDGKTIGGREVQLVVLDHLKCPSRESEVQEGDTIMSECSLAFSDHNDIGKIPHIVWTKGNEAISASEVKIAHNNTKSRINETADVALNGHEVVCMFKYMNIQDHCKTKYNVLFAARSPKLTINSRDFTNRIMKLEKGVHITIMCSASANPVANFSWYFIPIDYKKPLYAVSSKSSLELAKFHKDLSGEYTCEARNQFNGKVGEKASVTLQLKRDKPQESYTQIWMLAVGLGVLLALIFTLIGFILYVLRRIKRTIPVRGRQNHENREHDETLTPLSESCLDDRLLEVNRTDRNRNNSETVTSQSSTLISHNSTVSSNDGKLIPFNDNIKISPKTRYRSSTDDDNMTPESRRVMTSLNTGELTPLNDDNSASSNQSPVTISNKKSCRRCGGSPKPTMIVTLNNDGPVESGMISRL